MQHWLRAMVDQVQNDTLRANPPVEETAALRLQRLIIASGRQDEVSEEEMSEALSDLGIDEEVEQAQAMEQFASWL